MDWTTPGTMFFFGVANIGNGLFVYKYIHETKGVPLEEVPGIFAKAKDVDSDGGSCDEHCSA